MATFFRVGSTTPLYRNPDDNLCFVLPNQIRAYPYPVDSLIDFGFCIPLFYKHNNYVFNNISFQAITTVSNILNVINSSFFRDENGVVHSIYKASSDYNGVIELSSIPESLNIDDYIVNDGGFGFGFYFDDFNTNLYTELLDNSEQFQLAKSFLNDTDPAKELDPNYWTDTQLKFFDFVEKYNKNVISLRSTKKVNANVSGSISQSGEQQQIDLSPITNQLLNLNSKFEITKQDPNNNISYTENITKVLDDKQDTKNLVVETIEKAPFNPYLDQDNNDIYGV